jgi:Cys-tRNA(Pro)/Cys-tRNA(Cys) deacylase
MLVLATGNERLDLSLLRQLFKDKSLHFASPDEVLNYTGYPVGLVTPLGLKTPIPIYATANVTILSSCIISSGQIGTEIEITISNLLSVAKVKVLP